MRIARIINAVPQDHSNETNADAEPSIAVNPNNPREMVILAFTPPDSGVSNGPVFFSNDGGENWSLKFDVPGGEPHDQSPCFAKTSDEFYMTALAGNTGDMSVMRGTDPSTGTSFESFDDRSSIDQPWIEGSSVVGGSDNGKDRVYAGYNDLGHKPKSASVDVFLDARASTSFHQVRLDQRSPSPQDGYEIRPAIHRDGTVYIAFKSWTSTTATGVITNIVVVRDDNWGSGGSPFTALKDPSDNKAGRLVATGVPINDNASTIIGGIRLNNDLNIAVDPNNSDVVYIVWCDNAGPNYTLRVRRSDNRAQDWSGDLLTADNATLACLAINNLGTVGLLYQQLLAGNIETHFRMSNDGMSWDDTLLARTADPGATFAGDFARIQAVYNDFYGVFPAVNIPDPANFFPNGGGTFHFQRNTSGNQLRGTDDSTVISPSVDPFFFKILERDCVVITDRNTFGKDEVDALLHLGTPGVIPSAFYVIIDGFAANDLGITAATFSGTPNVAPNISFNPVPSGMTVRATACSAPDESNLNIPQRFTWTYEVDFTDDTAFNAEQVELTTTASMTSTGGINVRGQAVFQLTTQPNPYETDGPTSWLSVDLQVFSLIQGQSLHHTSGITLGSNPIDFIQRLLGSSGGYNDPALARAPNHPFDLDLVANEDNSTVTLAQNIFFGIPIYNFAVARVRYRALSTPAPNVRVFFRMFQMATTGTDYQPATTYAAGGLGATKIPLLGVVNGEVVTIPFFATPRVNPAGPAGLNAQDDPTNLGPLGNPIPPDASGNEVQVYFGCWLDINQPTPYLPDPNTTATAGGPYLPAQSIQQAIRGQHQCLVAEVNLDPPEPQITPGSSPATSDKLAQRNLNIVGVASPHQVPVTFDVKPTRALLPAGQAADEIMIDWANLPRGTRGNIYLPGTGAKSIIAMADRMYTVHGLSVSDPHTLVCAARGITYVPIPSGAGSNYAGLMTVDLPENVKRGASYKVITRQLTNISARRPSPPPPIAAIHSKAQPAAIVIDLIRWRRVLGTFQITIPVKTSEALLEPEERLLSVLRYIAQGIPQHNRWYPVFQRYLQQIGGRVIGLGGDPGKILPSPTGDGAGRPEPGKGGEKRVHYTGKISGLIYDRFGDFAGFLLDTEDAELEFSSRERDIEELAARAWRERLRITVSVERHTPHRPESIIVREPPARFRV